MKLRTSLKMVYKMNDAISFLSVQKTSFSS